MDEKQQEEVALFRFGVISDLVCTHLDRGEMAGKKTGSVPDCYNMSSQRRRGFSYE